ncbi:uncharacterized protein LOC105664310 isoform X1 [Megachile rotundata]|uniref:uncharacterized protein LOC105664310 isoform X1 n=1 Tax=Megachile rotundata TaxID=143995 RepID=UPI003FD3D0A1
MQSKFVTASINAIPSTSSPESRFQPTIETYVRIKPLKMLSSIHILMDSIVNLIEESQKTNKTNLLPKIFKPKSSQSDVFDKVVRKRIINFVKGESSTVIVYGMPQSGKTYTFIGNQDNPGIVPHAIKLLFSMVKCNTKPSYKVTMKNEIVPLDSLDEDSRKKKYVCSNYGNVAINTCVEAQLYLDHLDASVLMSEDRFWDSEKDLFSVWISLVKVCPSGYIDTFDTDNIYYDRCSGSTLRVTTYESAEFRNVTTALDACQLLISALNRNNYNREVHGIILTIKLLKYPPNYTPKCQESAPVHCSTMTFYDFNSESQFVTQDAMLANEYNFSEIFNANMKYIKAFTESNSGSIYNIFSSYTKFLRQELLSRQSLSFIATINIDALSNMLILHDLAILKSWYLNSEERQRNDTLEAAQPETSKDDEKRTAECIHDLVESWKSRNP